MKNAIIILGLVLAVLVIVWGVVTYGPTKNPPIDNRDDSASIDSENIRSFEDCVAAGLPVMESYPRRCNAPDGRVFAEEIEPLPTYNNASPDMIVVENPHPGGVVGKEFVVTGKARGGWYYEASFPIEVIDANGNVIARTFISAEGDWMSNEFVTFKSEIISLPSAYIGPATLILHKDNPSALPEHDASVSIPITVEY